jgi:chaperonin cofactor prefoldin
MVGIIVQNMPKNMLKGDLKASLETIRARVKLVVGFHSKPAAIEMGKALSDFIDGQEDKSVTFSIGFWLLEQSKPSPSQPVDLIDAIYFYHVLSVYYPRYFPSVY